jgi:hypothetical protein
MDDESSHVGYLCMTPGEFLYTVYKLRKARTLGEVVEVEAYCSVCQSTHKGVVLSAHPESLRVQVEWS